MTKTVLVDGKPTVRPVHIVVDGRGAMRWEPITYDGEELLETIDGRYIIISVGVRNRQEVSSEQP